MATYARRRPIRNADRIGDERADGDGDEERAEMREARPECAGDDRRTRDSDSFRGRESRRSYEASFFLDQKVMPRTDFALQLQQSLSQTVAEEVTNRNDRDQLVDRLDATVELVSKVGEGTAVSVLVPEAEG